MKRLVLAIFIFSFTLGAFAQKQDLDSLLNEILFDETDELLSILDSSKNYHFIYTKLNYTNRAIFAGRDMGIDQINLTGQAIYFHPSGLNFGVGGAWYSEFVPQYNTTILTIGYGTKAVRPFRFKVSYDRYFMANIDSVENELYNGSIDLGVSYHKKYLGARLDLSFLTGEKLIPESSFSLYSDLKLIKLGSYNDISFLPEITFFFSTEPVEYSQYGGLRGRTTQTDTQDVFGLLNTRIQLPLVVTLNDFDFEIGYSIHLPREIGGIENLPASTAFNISIGYIITLNP